MRLNKYLARAGIASRRKSDELIQAGKIKINGAVCFDFSRRIGEDDVVTYQGRTLQVRLERAVYLLHKPAGYISTSDDPQKRKTVLDLIDSAERLFTVGRLDRDTTGALVVTNDGDLAYKLTHPRFQIAKKYLVLTTQDIPAGQIHQLRSGIRLEDGSLARGELKRVHREGKNITWEIVLREGKNREVKRIFHALGSEVQKLHRTEFAGLSADNLKPGRYRRLSASEIRKLIALK